MKFISFELTMPNRASWNGRWSGEDKKYFVIKKIPDKLYDKKYKAKLNLHNNSANFYYRWEDGWGANVHVCLVDSKESNRRKKISSGFCAYNWMIDNILDHGTAYDLKKEEQPENQTA